MWSRQAPGMSKGQEAGVTGLSEEAASRSRALLSLGVVFSPFLPMRSQQPLSLVPEPPIPSPLGTQLWTPHGTEECGA